MSNTLLYIIVLILIATGVSLYAMREMRERNRKTGGQKGRDNEPELMDFLHSNDIRIEELGDEEDREIMRTIELIGHKAYSEMTSRIDKILKRHKRQKSVTLGLTCGPDTFDGAHELHGLLPGQEVKLVNCRSCGVDTIDVYYNGVRIGRLALTEALEVAEIMNGHKIVGAYVAEQNCYHRINSHQMNLIIFFETKRRQSSPAESLKSMLGGLGNDNSSAPQICLN